MGATLPGWDHLEPGGKIPELVKYPDQKQIFMYSAITWNRHMIHYNRDWARQEGHRDVVVQRALLGNYLAQCVLSWLGENGGLRRLKWKVLKSAFAGDELTCTGTIAGKAVIGDKRMVTCNVQILNQHGEIVASGTAELILYA